MLRGVLLASALTLATSALPEACAKVLGGGQGSAGPDTPPPPPPVPVTSATAPPIWAPPDPGGPQPTPVSVVNPDLAKARVHAAAGEHKKVRAILEKKLKAGKANQEEAQLLMISCSFLRDKVCMELVRAKHPEIDPAPAPTAGGG